MPLDGKQTRRAVLASMGSVTGTGTVVGTAVAQEGEDGSTGSGGGDHSSEGRPVQSPTRVTQDGVTIDYESCQVCHVSGDDSNVMYTEAHVEYFDSARGSTSHLLVSFWDQPLRTIDARELGGRLPDTAENPIVGEVEVWDVNFMPLTNLTQPAQWECREDF